MFNSPGFLAGLFGAASLIGFFVSLLMVAFVLYIAGRIVVGSRATFGKAFTIAFLGVIIGFLISAIVPFLGWLLAFLVWLYLIKTYFRTGWFAAFGIAIVAVIVTVVIGIIASIIFGVGLLGIGAIL